MIALVALIGVVALVTAVYGRVLTGRDVAVAAQSDAQFSADSAANTLSSGISGMRTRLSRTAADPRLAQAFVDPGLCSLDFVGNGAFASGHIDLIDQRGAVVCSSSQVEAGTPYASAPWLRDALSTGTTFNSWVDPRTGRNVLVLAAPIASQGTLVAFVETDALGTSLAQAFGGRRSLEFVVTDDRSIVSRSIDAPRWASTPLANTDYQRTRTADERVDVDGVERYYATGAVPEVGWTVDAGAAVDEALAPTNTRFLRTLGIQLAGLAIILVATIILYRLITNPIRRLSHEVRLATDPSRGPQPITLEGPHEVVSLGEDFHSLVTNADRQRANAERLAAIVTSSPDAIMSTDLDGIITSWNAGAERLYGYAASQAIGSDAERLMPTDRSGEGRDVLARVGGGHGIEQFETVRQHADGHLVEVSVTVAPLRDATGAVVGGSAIIRDITERNELDREHRDLELRLYQSERLESLGQLAGGIAHDFNNLLSLIINYAELADEQLEGHPARADVEQVRAAGERAARLTSQLLTFGAVDKGAVSTHDLNVVVAEVHSLLAHSLGEHVELEVALTATKALVRVDRGQLEQVLLNLAVNARDAMPDGGTLRIATESTTMPGPLTGSVNGNRRPPLDAVAIVVSDTGEGMSSDVRARLFEPFFTTKPQGQGTGLGLATVHRIIAKAGGTIAVDSNPGEGTEFRIVLPVEVSTTSEAPASPLEPSAQGSGEAILIVEDEAALMDLAVRLLERNGYRTLAAATGTEALRLAERHPEVSLVLTDSVMPQMSGQALAAHIDALRPGLPVVFMSGYSRGIQGPQPGGDDDLLRKPFSEATLLERVSRALHPDG